MSGVLTNIESLQKDCLIHRYLYYVHEESIIDDFEYDMREHELKRLREANPEIWEKSQWREWCPTETIGSSLEESYPEEIVEEAWERLMNHQDLLSFITMDAEDDEED